MKKIMTIGDLHGKKIWKTFADIKHLMYAEKGAAGFGAFEPDYDYYIFIGDYCDAFDKDNQTIKDNLLELIKFKELYPDNVILLWGNHELHYVLDLPWVSNGKYECTGYRPEVHYDLYDILNKNFELFQLAFQHNNYLFTHAGVHVGWYDKFVKQYKELEEYLNELEIDYKKDNLADKLNTAFIHKVDCIFDVGHRRGGHARVGGPLWLDKGLANKPLGGYHQIVGHTATKNIHTFNKNEDTTITFIDVLANKKAFYVIND